MSGAEHLELSNNKDKTKERIIRDTLTARRRQQRMRNLNMTYTKTRKRRVSFLKRQIVYYYFFKLYFNKMCRSYLRTLGVIMQRPTHYRKRKNHHHLCYWKRCWSIVVHIVPSGIEHWMGFTLIYRRTTKIALNCISVRTVT